MGSVRDPEGTAAMEAAELERAKLAARQTRTQAAAARQRERAMKGSRAARRELAKDYAPVSAAERARLKRTAPPTVDS